MAKLNGRGVASVNYPTGMNLGGDPSQALIHATTTGSFVITLSSVDLGQGIKTVAAQIAAETLGMPYENVMVDTADTDTGPHCMGTFASRGTHRIGNAVMMAAREAREVMMSVAATELEVDAADLVTDGKGRIHVNGAPDKGIDIVPLALAAHFKHGKTISGRGIFLKPKSEPVPETGEMDPDSCQAHACTVAEVEVDDETGEITVLKMTNAYEVGRAVNPALAHQQINGGAWMGISHALYETTEPYYPDRAHGPLDFSQYLMPGPGDLATMDSVIIERPASNGPYGAKGIGEMTANAPIPAIANAIFNACGVRVLTMPITPEKVLRGIDALRASGQAAGLLTTGKTTMIKVMSLMKRKPELSFADFKHWLQQDHPKLAKAIPGMRKYTVNVLTKQNDDLGYDGVSEMWFDSEAAMIEAFGTEPGKAAGGDTAAHCANRTRMVCDESVQW